MKGITTKRLLKERGVPLLRFKPQNKRTYDQLWSDTPLECMVFKIPDKYQGGIIVYSRYNHIHWIANTGERHVIRKLMQGINPSH